MCKMSEHNKRESSSTPVDPPVKRKRGRPRKDENFVQKERALLPQAPSSDVVSNQHAEVDPSDNDNGMVGQVVSGVIEGSFDAGYFLSVRAGNTNTLLRGVVFQPGLFNPITAANDVAPHAKMYKRREFPIPIFNPQGQVNGSIPLPSQSGSVKVRLTDTLQKNDPGASLGGKDMPQQNSELWVGSQSSPPQLKAGAPFPHAKQSAFGEVHTTDSLPNNLGASLEAKNTPQRNCVFGLENQFAHQLRSATPFALATQSASAMVPLTRNSCNASLGEKNFPQQNSVSGLEKQSYTQLQSGTPFPIASGYAFSAEKSSEPSLGNQPIPHLQSSESSLDNQSIPRLQTGTPLALADQSASIMVPPPGNLPKNDLGASLEEKNSAQQNSLFECGDLSTPQLDNHRITEQDEIMKELGASTLQERPQNDVEETKDVILASEPTGDVFPSKENINQMPQVQHQVVDSELQSSESAQDEKKSRYLDLHSQVGANSRSLPPDKHISLEK